MYVYMYKNNVNNVIDGKKCVFIFSVCVCNCNTHNTHVKIIKFFISRKCTNILLYFQEVECHNAHNSCVRGHNENFAPFTYLIFTVINVKTYFRRI